MIPTFIILFREVLEMAIILSIVLAATRGVNGRGRWVAAGLAGGLAGAVAVALFAGAISEAVEGAGQELFNAAVLLLAAGMIGWTAAWMKIHARGLAMKIRGVGQQVGAGELPLYSVAAVVALSMWREGAEIVLFMMGILSASAEPVLAIAAGGAAGAGVAAVIGLLLYFGLITLSVKHAFAVTGWLLVLLAAGMSAQGAGFLIQAGWLPEIAAPLWDTSHLLSQSSVGGRILHAMLGYTERPSAMQVIWYLGTAAAIVALMRVARGPQPQPGLQASAAQG